MSKTTILYKDIAPGAAEDGSVSVSASSSLTTPQLLLTEQQLSPSYTCEHNYWSLNGSFVAPNSQDLAFWSTERSGVDGTFQNPPVITIDFDQQYSSVGITLIFDRGAEEYCNSVNIKWYQAGSLKSEKDFSPNSPTYFCQNQVTSYDRLVITINSTNIPERYAKLEQIIIGIYRYFGMGEIRSASITNEMSLIGTELPISTMNWTLDSDDDVDFMFQFKQPVEVRNDNSLIGVYYIDGYSRSSKRIYSIECYDALGVMDEVPFQGGVYVSGKSAKELFEEIVDGDFEIEYASGIVDTTLYGILEQASKREAMQQVLFAWGVCASTDGTDVIRVFSAPEDEKEIGRGQTYTGVTVDTSSIVTKVSVTAHTYTESENGSVEIDGVKYEDTKTVYEVSNPDLTATDKQNVVEISNATLVSPSIGQAVAQRVYDYNLRRNTNKAKIVWNGEKLGDYVSLPNAWGSSNSGNISKMEILLSNTVAATCASVGI